MNRIWLTALLPFLFAGCNIFSSTENPAMIADDILAGFVQTEDPALLAYYADEIAECKKLDAAYAVCATEFDLNQDGTAETISYMLSTLNSGSSGNIMLYVHSQDSTFPFSEEIFLNPHTNGTNPSPRLQIIESKHNGFYDIRYAVFDDSSTVITKQDFCFDGMRYTS